MLCHEYVVHDDVQLGALATELALQSHVVGDQVKPWGTQNILSVYFSQATCKWLFEAYSCK